MSSAWASLRGRLLLPVVVLVPLVAGLVGLAWMALSSVDDTALAQNRAASGISGLEHALGDRRRAKEVFAQLVAAQEGLVAAMADHDPVAVAQLLVPLKARMDLGFVTAHGLERALLTYGGAKLDDQLAPLGESALAGISSSIIAAGDSGVLVAATSPVKGPDGVIGWIAVGRTLSADELAAITDERVEVAIYQEGGRLLAASAGAGEIHPLLAVRPRSPGSVEALNTRLHEYELWAAPYELPHGGSLVAIVSTLDLSLASQRRAWLMLFGTVSVVCALLIVSALVARSVIAPLQAMGVSTAAMARGDYQQRVAARGIRELDELAGAINYVAGEVERQVSELAHRAFHDELTHLPNRALFLDRLEHALATSRRERSPVTVCVLDVDEFKTVNDSLGHAAGDQLLVLLAARLGACLRPSDTLARFGGDEFTLLIDNAAASTAAAIADRIAEALLRPFQIENREVVVSMSIGIAVSSDIDQPESLVRNADVAMYRAKAGGKRGYVVFETSMHTAALARLDLVSDLRRAIDRDELVLHYQPMVRLESGEIIGLEALVRWNHPDRGLLSPLEFIPVAEEAGLIVPLGRWVLSAAVRQAAEWVARFPHITMAINLSALQLEDSGFIEHVKDVLEQTGVDSRSLVLEVTESIVTLDAELARVRLAEFKALGIRLAIDDFGTGYSSLGYLRQFPFDLLKIDKSFVDDLTSTREGDALMMGILQLSGSLQLTSVAEGVEDADQAARLRGLGCELAQGFYFARPAPADVVEHLLEGGRLPVGTAAGPPKHGDRTPRSGPRPVASRRDPGATSAAITADLGGSRVAGSRSR